MLPLFTEVWASQQREGYASISGSHAFQIECIWPKGTQSWTFLTSICMQSEPPKGEFIVPKVAGTGESVLYCKNYPPKSKALIKRLLQPTVNWQECHLEYFWQVKQCRPTECYLRNILSGSKVTSLVFNLYELELLWNVIAYSAFSSWGFFYFGGVSVLQALSPSSY